MTLILSVQTKGSIWLMADRRLTVRNRPTKEDARKIALLETTDGRAIIGYAGLGSTSAKTEPSTWIGNVLRGRNLPMEQALDILTEAMKREFPRHLKSSGQKFQHDMLIPAYVGGRHHLYVNGVIVEGEALRHRYTRYIVGGALEHKDLTPPVAIAGSGALLLYKNTRWMRPLLSLVRAYNGGRVRPQVVADHLAAIAYRVHGILKDRGDQTVGPRSIVVWRNGGVGGGGQEAYTNGKRDGGAPILPNIACGLDVTAIANSFRTVMAPHLAQLIEAVKSGGDPNAIQFPSDKEFQDAAAQIPSDPNEQLS